MNKRAYMDWRFRGTTWVSLMVFVLCIVASFVLHEDVYGLKNSSIERLQSIMLLLGLYVTLTARENKRLYTFASLVLFFVLAREVNYGRTLSCFVDPHDPAVFPKWKEMEYGWLAHVGVGLYAAWLLVYFIWRKVWRELVNVLREFRMPVIDAMIATVGLVVALLSEAWHHNMVEELGELLLYVSGVGILYLYTRLKLERFE